MTTTNNYFDGDVQVNNTLTATALVGDGSGITGLPPATVTGTPNYMPYFDGSGNIQSEQFITAAQGGLNADNSASTGVVKFTAGTPSVASGQIVNTDVSNSAAIAISKIGGTTANKVICTDASGNLTANSYQTVDASGNIKWLTPVGASLTLETQTSGNTYFPNGKIFMDNALSGNYYDQFIKFSSNGAAPTAFLVLQITPNATARLSFELCGRNATTGAAWGCYSGTKAIFTTGTVAAATFLPTTQSGAGTLETYVEQQTALVSNPLSFTYTSPQLFVEVNGLAGTLITWSLKFKYQRNT